MGIADDYHAMKDKLEETQRELSEVRAELTQLRARMENFINLAGELVGELHQLDELLDTWRKDEPKNLLT